MRVALVAGETSGDLLGAGLIRELRQRVPDATFEGVAGPEMAAAGCAVLEPADTLAVFGLIEPLSRIPRLLRLRRSLVRRWRADPPDAFVGIDSPDFNLGLEIQLKSAGIPTAHYVCPSVWAWRQGRVAKIARAVDRVLCLLPFEKNFLTEHGIAADFVGHPLASHVPGDIDSNVARSRLGIASDRVIAILPGSRMSEVTRLTPVFLATARLLAEQYPDIRFVAPMATGQIRDYVQAHAGPDISKRISLIDGDAESAIIAADVVLLASGTATLQTALLERPMVVAYRLAALTFAIARVFDLVKVSHVSLPNLLTDTPLVPEFIQDKATPSNLAGAVAALIDDDARRTAIVAEFARLRTTLARNADRRAADAVLDLAGRHAG